MAIILGLCDTLRTGYRELKTSL